MGDFTFVSSETTRRFAMIEEKPGARQDWANRPSFTSLKQAAWSWFFRESQPSMLMRKA